MLNSVFPSISVDSYITGEVSYINSRGINLIRTGFNETYSTTFKNLNYRFGAVVGLKINYEQFSFGGEVSYLSRISSSESNSYSFQEKITYNDIGAAIVFEYFILEFGNFKMVPLVKFGVSLNYLKLEAEPMPTDSSPEKMSVFNYYGDLGINFYYMFIPTVSAFVQVAGRYSTSPTFVYYDSEKTGNVELATGQAITVNTSGAYILVGVCFNIWR